METFEIDSQGRLSLQDSGRFLIFPSPAATLVSGGKAWLPQSADRNGEEITLHFPAGDCVLRSLQKNRYRKLTVVSVPENTQGLVFGPYRTQAREAGEILGAGWYEDGSVACIQSLMPKVEGGCKILALKDTGGLPLLSDAAAAADGAVYLQCSVSDRTKESRMDYLDMKNVIVQPVPLPDGGIPGAAVALIGAKNAEDLLSVISDMELTEGLPHPTMNGEYVRTSHYAESCYMIFGGEGLTNAQRLEYAGRAGVSGIYFGDLLERWGHFTVDKKNFPNGISDVARDSEIAAKYGADVGTHTLSNFIHTNDPYVTPVPHNHLLVMDKTALTRPVTAEDPVLFIRDANNFATESTLNTIRIGDELITFSDFDAQNMCLTGCTRGAFGTSAAAHEEGDTVSRLWDHGYKTLFPDILLQREMADCLGHLMKDGKMRRMSFDGLEGCSYTDGGEFAMADYVQRVINITGNEILCEGSRITHYLWHAFSYCNWGEPWYDDDHRGGLYAYRASHIPYFRRNLMPTMLGWYALWLNRGRYEATLPENVEFILSRSAGYDAGMALCTDSDVARTHGMYETYLDMARLWRDFRKTGSISDDLREKLQDETKNWHLEKTDSGWELREIIIRTRDLDYTDRVVKAEAGYVDNRVKQSILENRRNHSSHMVFDVPYDGVEEEPRFRIRVGEPGHGLMENPEFPCLKFSVTAQGGDYLEYRGGTELYHLDPNLNVIEVCQGVGRPLTCQDLWFKTMQYTTDTDDQARYLFREFRTRKIYHIPFHN